MGKRIYRRRGLQEGTSDEKKPRILRPHVSGVVPKRKYAIIFGYLGTAYHGMQKQLLDEGAIEFPTIEGALIDALTRCEAITEAQRLDFSRLQLGRVGRTDKGVHAACQIVTVKLSLGPLTDEQKALLDASASTSDDSIKKQAAGVQRVREIAFAERLRKELPNDIQLFDVTRVSGSFDARIRATSRQYEYCLPAVFLRPAVLVDNTSVLEEFWTTYGKDIYPNYVIVPYADKKLVWEALRDEALSVSEINRNERLGSILAKWGQESFDLRFCFSQFSAEVRRDVFKHFGCEENLVVHDDGAIPFPPQLLLGIQQPHLTQEAIRKYRASDEDLMKFKRSLKKLEGHHQWFNFTSRIKSDDKSGARKIMSVDVYRAFEDSALGEILVVRFHGQSFLFNQIRKMISAAIESYVGTAPVNTIDFLYTPPLDPKKHLHLAPGEGLLLERAYFDIINRQNDVTFDRLVLHDEYELKNAYTEKLYRYMEKGEKCVQNPPNPLITGHNSPYETVTCIPWDSNKPSWHHIVNYKVKTIIPWILHMFTQSPVFNRYINDLLWHPFFLENMPEVSRKDKFHHITRESGCMSETGMSTASKE